MSSSSKLTRRRFLINFSLTSLGIAGVTKLAWDHLQLPSTDIARALPKIIPKPKPKPAKLPKEEDYKDFIASLQLRYISPQEVIAAHYRERGGVKNSLPPRELWQRIAPTLRIADELRARLGQKLLYITSAYRSPDYNSQCPGAARNSYHIKNCALDLVYDCSPAIVMREAKAMRSERFFKGGLGLYHSFVHVDTRGYNATW